MNCAVQTERGHAGQVNALEGKTIVGSVLDVLLILCVVAGPRSRLTVKNRHDFPMVTLLLFLFVLRWGLSIPC